MRRRFALLLVGLAVLMAGCAQRAPQDTLRPASPDTRTIAHLYHLTFWVAVFVFILVEGLLVFAVVRHRDRGEEGPEPIQTHGNTRLELGWTVAPALILLVLAVPTIGTLLRLSRSRPNPVRVTVIGHQWWWEYRYTDLGVITANELHLPVHRNVELTLKSDDVIHSYWVPRLFGKHDVEPGRVSKINASADDPGVYLGQCVEFCGLSHANMRLRAIAQTATDFDTWVASQKVRPAAPAAGSDAEAGMALFTTKGCAGCHTVDGISSGMVGPNLTHVTSRTSFAGSTLEMNPENLRKWLHDPPGVKPGSKMPNLHLSDDEITKLIAYLETLH
jgi:cytochrome c oxidase subunit 2